MSLVFRRRPVRGFLLLLLALCVAVPPALAAETAYPLARFHPVTGTSGMVAAPEARAARIGVDILQRGGNAVDAAVAVGFALAVTLPRAGNLGGGGFMLVHDADDGDTIAIDYRETAPAAATRDMFLGPDGEVDKRRERFSHKAVAVPGTVAGLLLALERYGSLPLKDVIAPAVTLAEDGILVSADMARNLLKRRERLARWPSSAKIFMRPDGEPLPAGQRLVQPDLARSLRMIAEEGRDAFYSGDIAK
ncbi:MAG: gamma-glutamyltransferase, partial [Pseudomonadota bacterium]